MALTTTFSLLIFLSSTLLLSLSPQAQAQAQTPSAPPPGPINITAILARGGQYSNFIRLITQTTTVANQINTQVNSSTQGMTVFAPTDNAFNTLPAGTLNNLSPNQQVQLVQYHLLSRYYALDDLLTVSNPVPTQASGPDGRVYGLNFTGQNNQVNVSTGVVETQVNSPFGQEIREGRLAVYSVEKVLLPSAFFEAPTPAGSPPSANRTSDGSGDDSPDGADSPPNGSGRMNVGLGFVGGLGLFCMGLLF